MNISVIAAALAAGLAALATPALADIILIRAGRVITDASKPARGPSTIVVRDGRIVEIVSGQNAVTTAAQPGEKVADINLASIWAA